jgi:hypothetical protein
MRQLMRDLFRSPRRGSALLVCACAPAAALACWYFGADVSHALAIGACFGAVGIAWIAWPDEPLTAWRENREPRQGGRWDVARLAWSLHGGRGRVGRDALRRAQAIGRTRLAARQLDPLEPSHAAAIEKLIGSSALGVLSFSGSPTPTLRALVNCLDALDALEPADVSVAHVAAPSLLRVMLRLLGRRPAVSLPRRGARRAA